MLAAPIIAAMNRSTPLRRAALPLAIVSVLALGGCAVAEVAGATVGAAISVTGAVVSTGVKVAGKVVEKTVDVVTPGSSSSN